MWIKVGKLFYQLRRGEEEYYPTFPGNSFFIDQYQAVKYPSLGTTIFFTIAINGNYAARRHKPQKN